MTVRAFFSLLTFSGMGLVAVACDPAPPAAEATTYEQCREFITSADEPREACGDGLTICFRSPAEWGGGFCTAECETDSDCPSIERAEIRCERFAIGGSLCAVVCDVDADEDECPSGTTCTEMDRDATEVAYCMP